LGWSVALQLATLGVGSLVLIDPDVVEVSNRSRLILSTAQAVGRSKVSALAELIATIGGTTVTTVSASFADASARSAAARADVIVSATDTLVSRFDADRFARRLLIPLIDCGINIQLADGHVSRIGGRVSVSWPTAACLSCAGVLDPDAIAREVDPLGYRGKGPEEAAVVAFNTVLAGLASAEVLELLIPHRGAPPTSRQLMYDGLRGIVREIALPPFNTCGTCGELPGAVFGRLP
jgi:molybdopterin/thiamine biosynthesis adenylyltransferase